MKKRLLKLVLLLGAILLLLVSYPLARLTFTDAKVAKSLFSDTYYVKLEADESEYHVFTDYMEGLGWVENQDLRMGGGHLFERKGASKHIINKDIKTALIDGKPNLSFLDSWFK